MAQIIEVITVAQKSNVVNVLTMPMDYKNSNFSDFDSMGECTLDW